MKIKNLDEAFEILDTPINEIPFEAIDYVYNHPPDQKILKKILFSIKNAYNTSVYYNSENDYFSPTPLWYAIIAEKHNSKLLIDPLINLYTTIDDTWDFLDEQGLFLTGVFSEKYPDIAIPKIFNKIEQLISINSHFPYLYLFDVLFFVDLKRYKSRILKILSKNFIWYECFAEDVASLQIKEACPMLREIIEANLSGKPEFKDLEIDHIRHSLKILETGFKNKNDKPVAYSKERKNWDKFYLSRKDFDLYDRNLG